MAEKSGKKGEKMHQENHNIIAIHIHDRLDHAPEVQKVLTKYGSNIKTRIGLHDVDENFSANTGVLLLEMVGKEQRFGEMVDELKNIPGIETKKIVFEHE